MAAAGGLTSSAVEPTRRPRVKVCCISSPGEARLAVSLGASALGLVSAMPSGPGVIDEELICRIAGRVPPGVATFLLTARRDADAIVEQQRRCRANTLQLVDVLPLDGAVHQRLRAALPGVGIVQVVHVGGADAVDEALALAPHVDALLLDSGNAFRPRSGAVIPPGDQPPVKELGGTGRLHDWAISRRIRELSPVPIYLAGGLRPENVAEAIDRVGPFGLDVCSGVRTDGRLDPVKLERFFAAVAAASA
jgi:phosphoribosylanthranilate isomerase